MRFCQMCVQGQAVLTERRFAQISLLTDCSSRRRQKSGHGSIEEITGISARDGSHPRLSDLFKTRGRLAKNRSNSEHTKNVRDWKEVFDVAVSGSILSPVSPDPDDDRLTEWCNRWPQYPPELS
ncbi:hypothetical protein PanWU01x14_177310 [Parasponia andersonii]|uniref:Uncharacterized protein n=1 Tax=Parasponia andersonii TaxID=3476 RepID=A0A2P5C7L4_PARAD|nr:hypothetical protein PanWU01x14_177310 [Parasponia andersonii]